MGARPFIIFFLLAGLFGVDARAANLVPNGDFNTPSSKPNRPAGWSHFSDDSGNPPPQLIERYLTTGGIGNTPCIEVGHSYARFAEFFYDSDNYARYRVDANMSIGVDANQYYKFTVMYVTSGIDNNQAVAEIQMYDGSSFIHEKSYFLPPSEGWTQFTAYYRNVRSSDRGFGQVNTDNVRIQLGVVSSLGIARFDNASLEPVSALEYSLNYPLYTATPPPLNARRPRPQQFPAAAAWSIRRDPASGAFWFVRPDGTPTWLRAVQLSTFSQFENPVLFNNLNPAFRGAGITSEAYALDSYTRLGFLGFNSDAINDGGNLAHHPFGQAHIHSLSINREDYPAGLFLVDKNGNYDTSRKPMPDPYNPNLQPFLAAHVRQQLDGIGARGPGHPDFVGYFTDNELGVEALDEFIWSPYTSTEFILWVRDRYDGSIQAVNAAWSSPSYVTFNMGSFSDILLNKDKIIRHHLDDPIARDLNDFTKKMLKDYYRLVCGTIRQYEVSRFGDSDGNGIANIKHLICTNRYDLSRYPAQHTPDMLRTMEAIAELNAEQTGYGFDVLAVNNYPGDEHIEGVRTQSNFQLLERMAQISGLPVLITEFGVHGRDSGIPTGNNTTDDKGWFHRSVETQFDRAMVYDKSIRQWAGSPYIIGAQWFRWIDVLKEGGTPTVPVSPDDPNYIGRNSGVVDNNNNYYVTLATQMQVTNAALDAAFAPIVQIPISAELVRQFLLSIGLPLGLDANVDGAVDVADLMLAQMR